MNINPEYSSNNPPSAIEVMDEAMNYIWETLIEPNQADLDEQDATLIAVIGAMFKDIAKDAEAYHKIQAQGFEENPYSRN